MLIPSILAAILFLQSPQQAVVQRACYGPEYPHGALIRGRVTDFASGRGVFNVDVRLDDSLLARTDCKGDFIILQASTGDHRLQLSRERYAPESLAIAIVAGQRQQVTVRLRELPLPPPPVALLVGRWRLAISEGASDVARYGALDVNADSYELPFRNYARGYLRWIGGDTPESSWPPLYDVAPVAVGLFGDTVRIAIHPLDSHGGRTLIGRLQNDIVTGSWCAHGYDSDCWISGRFTLTRAEWPAN